MKTPDLNSVQLKRVEGHVCTIKLTFTLDTKRIPAAQYRKFWKSLATAMVCTMTPAQQKEFASEIEDQMRKFRGAK